MYQTGSSIFTKYRLSEVSICLNSSNDIPIRPTTTFACTRTNFHVRGLLIEEWNVRLYGTMSDEIYAKAISVTNKNVLYPGNGKQRIGRKKVKGARTRCQT